MVKSRRGRREKRIEEKEGTSNFYIRYIYLSVSLTYLYKYIYIFWSVHNII